MLHAISQREKEEIEMTGKYVIYFSGKSAEADRPSAWTVLYPDDTKKLVPYVDILSCPVHTEFREMGMPTTGVLVIEADDVRVVSVGVSGGLIFHRNWARTYLSESVGRGVEGEGRK